MRKIDVKAEAAAKPLQHGSWKRDIKTNWQVYLIFLPVFVYFVIFSYLPMIGLIMSFQNYNVRLGLFGSEFVGFDNFVRLFQGEHFLRALKNTVIIGIFNVAFGFIAPLVFALLITEIKNKKFRKFLQVCSYMPNFVAAMVICTLINQFFDINGAITTLLCKLFGLPNQNWMAVADPPVFWLIYSITGAWQSFGYGSIIFVAAICNINSDLYEASSIDGANRWKKMWHVTIPQILPTVIMLLTLQIGTMFKSGFDRILLLYSPGIYEVADTLYTYTYRMAFGDSPDFGLSAASGLFQSIVGTVLLVFSNWLSRKTAKTSLY